MTRTSIKSRHKQQLRAVTTLLYIEVRSYYEVERRTGVHRALVRYWVRKFWDPSFHSEPNGGDKRSIWTKAQLPVVYQEVLWLLETFPRSKLKDIAQYFSFLMGKVISKQTMSVYLRKMGWSWKVPCKFQINKYNQANMLYYVDYLLGIQLAPLEKLKFADESHIVSKNLGTSHCWGLKNQRVYLKEQTLHAAHASITILTSLNGRPVVADYREETNTQWDFVDFVCYCCFEGHLTAGDYLVLDNAAVHAGYDSSFVLLDLLEVFEVKLVFLPTYSPELNPCELVFNVMKRFIRDMRDQQANIPEEVKEAIARITTEHMESFYQHCVFPKTILPDLKRQ